LPSYREGLPRVLLEAGLAERAVVASDVPGCREVIVHEQSGLLTPPADAAALAAALQRVLTDCPLRRRLAGNLHQRVCRDFSLDQVVDRFVQIYEQMLVPTPARAPAAMRGAPVLA
jgi:glycosyltransferase involved in cell wall biosynthesis